MIRSAALRVLAPDQRLETGWFWPVLADGGAFESEYVWLCTTVGGRVARPEELRVP